MKAQAGGFRNSSYFNHTVKATASELIAIAKHLGAEYGEDNTGADKTNFDFDFETDNGVYFTVYDWKEYRAIDLHETIEWHIGGENSTAASEGQDELQAMLTAFRKGELVPA